MSHGELMIEPGFRARVVMPKPVLSITVVLPPIGVCVFSCVRLFVTPWTPPGSSVHGIFQARILEMAAIFYFRGSSQPTDQTHISCVSCIGRQILYHCTTWGAPRCLCTNSISCLFMQCFFSLTLYSFLQSRPSWYIHLFS